jgi:hypothetical protein
LIELKLSLKTDTVAREKLENGSSDQRKLVRSHLGRFIPRYHSCAKMSTQELFVYHPNMEPSPRLGSTFRCSVVLQFMEPVCTCLKSRYCSTAGRMQRSRLQGACGVRFSRARPLLRMQAAKGFGRDASKEPGYLSPEEVREAIRFLVNSAADPAAATLRQRLRRQLRKQYGPVIQCGACHGKRRSVCLMCNGSCKMKGFLGDEVPCYPCQGTGLGRPCRECNGMGFFSL